MIDLSDGAYTVVVDSVEDGLATVFFEQDGEEVASEVLDAGELPEAGRHADAILEVTVREGEVVEWLYESAETEERQDEAHSRFDRLAIRPPSDENS